MVVWASAAAAILLVPLIGMQLSDDVDWGLFDFLLMGALLAAVAIPYELAARTNVSGAYRAGLGLTLVSAFLLIWINGAVGVIGSEDNPANLLYAGVLVIALTGAMIARFRPIGMSRAVSAAGLAQLAVGAAALAGGWGDGGRSWPGDVIGVTLVFTAAWLVAAALFRHAADRANA
jgi:hypothetical protein